MGRLCVFYSWLGQFYLNLFAYSTIYRRGTELIVSMVTAFIILTSERDFNYVQSKFLGNNVLGLRLYIDL